MHSHVDRRRAGVEGLSGVGEDSAGYPEGSDAVSVEIPLEVSPMMWDPCLVRWEMDADREVEWAVGGCASVVVWGGAANLRRNLRFRSLARPEPDK